MAIELVPLCTMRIQAKPPVEGGPRKGGVVVTLCAHRDASCDLRTRVEIYQQYFLMLQY